MKRILSVIATVIFLFSVSATPALAQDDFSGLTSISSANGEVLKKIKEYIETIAKFYGIDLTDASKYPETPNLDTLLNEYTQLMLNPLGRSTILGASYFNKAVDQPSKSATQLTLTQQALKNILTTPPVTKNIDKCRNDNCIDRFTLMRNLSAIGVPTPYEKFGSSSENLNTFDVNTLLGPFKYKNDQITALNFIRFATNHLSILNLPDYVALSRAKNSEDPSSVNAYYDFLHRLPFDALQYQIRFLLGF